MNKTLKTLIFWSVIVVSSVLLWQIVRTGSAQAPSEISYSSFLAQVEDGKVSKVVINACELYGYNAAGRSFKVITPSSQSSMIELLRQHNVEIWFKDVSVSNWPAQILGTWGPLILLASLWFFMVRRLNKTNRPLNQGGSSEQPRFGP
jgi:cell division protease FtsH